MSAHHHPPLRDLIRVHGACKVKWCEHASIFVVIVPGARLVGSISHDEWERLKADLRLVAIGGGPDGHDYRMPTEAKDAT